MNNSHLYIPFTHYKKPLRWLSIIGLSTLFIGCQSVHHGSVQSRSQLLAKGIQEAYSVPQNNALRIAPFIIESADHQQVSSTLLAAIIRQESHYRSNAKSSGGAIGLTQIIPKYWKSTCEGNLYEEKLNVNCGALVLSRYYQQAGNWKKALAYYNVGPHGYKNNRKFKKQGKRYAKQVKKQESLLKKAL